MKKVPYLLALGFIGITIIRVSRFVSDGSLAWSFIGILFAIMLALSVFTSSYFTGYVKTRKSAFIALCFFVLIDGYFNFIETLVWSVEVGRWDFAIQFGSIEMHIYRFADAIYGLFPTIAAALLGWLTRKVTMLPPGKRKGFTEILLNLFTPSEAGQSHENAQAISKANKQSTKTYPCKICKREFATIQALSAHMRFCAKQEVNMRSTNGNGAKIEQI